MGAMEAAERMKRMKFKKETRRIGKEHERRSFEEAIDVFKVMKRTVR